MRVEKMARDLGVTKGSFYWHFHDAAALMEALLVEWEDEAELLIKALRDPKGAGPRELIDTLAARVMLSEEGEVPSDAAIFGWAAVDPRVQKRVAAAEEERIALVSKMAGGRERGEIVYMAYLGFILRRRSAGNAADIFGMLARFMTDALAGNADNPVSLSLENGGRVR